MPRTKRIEFEHAHYHAFDHGVRRTDLYGSDDDRRLFLKLFAETCLERSWRCLADCLMGNHYHLLVRTDKPGLSGGMQMLKARYAEYVNRKYALSGHAFERRFNAKPILTDVYLLEVLRYIVLNPVAARMCARVDEWPWSSHAAMVGTRSHRDWFDRSAALALFGRDEARAVTGYLNFVAAGELLRALPTESDFNRHRRDAAIRQVYARGGISMRELAQALALSHVTVKRVLQGSDPS